MKRLFFLFLPFLLFVAGVFVTCEKVGEAGKYDNWVSCSRTFIGSTRAETGNSIVASLENTKNMEIGKLYAIKVETGGASVDGNSKPQYAYCKRLRKEGGGVCLLFTDKVSTYYYGAFITREEFDGNSDSSGATDSKLPLSLSSPSSESSELLIESKWPTDSNSPSEFFVSKIVSRQTWSLQYMQVDERQLLYIPWQSGHGSSNNSSIPGYSSSAFDVYLKGIM